MEPCRGTWFMPQIGGTALSFFFFVSKFYPLFVNRDVMLCDPYQPYLPQSVPLPHGGAAAAWNPTTAGWH